jgi:LPS O-antigen subunit length determinant protein (WzzB/FepE family)
MNDKEIPLSSTPYQVQNSKHEPEDEISLFDMLGALVRKKVIIFFTASIFIVLSIFYAFSVTPTYRATIGLQPPGKNLTSFFPDFLHEVLPNVSPSTNGALVIKNNYMLNKFIAELQSYSNQEEVFIEGKFYEKFVSNNPEIDIKKEIIQEIYRSIHTSAGGELSAKVVNFEMTGVNPEVASDFLNALADWVGSKVEVDIQESIQKGVEAQIALLSAQLNARITMEQLEYEDKIRVFTDNIGIAKNLGILGNNFDNYKPDGSTFLERLRTNHESGKVGITVTERIKEKAGISWPVWYLYGQRALEQELNVIKRRGASSQYAKETVELISKIEQLSKIDLSKINFAQVIISQPSIPPVNPVNIKKINIIAIGIVFGLFIGILMALLSLFITQAKERSKLSPPGFIK